MSDIWDIETEGSPVIQKKNSATDTITLSTLQKDIVLKRWNDESKDPPSIPELLKLVYPNDSFDGRSKQAAAIKELLVNNGFSEEEVKLGGTKRSFELSPEHKEYIKNNYSTMRAIEMARELFGDNISPASSQVRETNNYLRTLDKKPMYGEEIDSNYLPPRNIDRAVSRIKKYVDETKDWDSKKLTPTQKKQVEALINYLASYRFKHQIDSYEAQSSKELFESSFIKYTYDKSDLSQENCDQYIILCSEVVISSNIQDTINMLQREQDRVLNDEGKISMAVVEAIKTARAEHNDCIKRQQALYKSLTQERSDKLSEEIKDKASLLNLINAWKNYESRQNFLKLAKDKKGNLRKELHELANLEDIKMRILGMDIEEILNG